MRVVLDTNILVSGFLHPERGPAQLLQHALQHRLVLLYAHLQHEATHQWFSQRGRQT